MWSAVQQGHFTKNLMGPQGNDDFFRQEKMFFNANGNRSFVHNVKRVRVSYRLNTYSPCAKLHSLNGLHEPLGLGPRERGKKPVLGRE